MSMTLCLNLPTRWWTLEQQSLSLLPASSDGPALKACHCDVSLPPALHNQCSMQVARALESQAMAGNLAAMAGMAALNLWKGAGGKDKRAKATVK